MVRSYSIASLPSDDPLIELQVQRKANGEMTEWIFNQFKVGDSVNFQGPIGECFYSKTHRNSRLILIGTGTGAAPLIGILRDALKSNHQAPIIFYHGTREFDGLYLHHRLIELEKKEANFKYQPCLSMGQHRVEATQILQGYCNEIALKSMSMLASTSEENTKTLLYLCGNPEMVKQTRKKAFLMGIPLNNIYTDAFEYKDLRKKPR